MTLLFAVILDSWAGDPRRWHPLALFGRLVENVETLLNPPTQHHNRRQIIFGGSATLILASITGLAVYALTEPPIFGDIFAVIVLYFTLAGRSLADHADAVCTALENDRIDEARTRVGFMVSRDTQAMNQAEIVSATIESTLENGNDAVFGAIFWFFVAGAPGAAIYRVINTLDAMWGYRNDRFLYFGRVAARLDDVLNWLPARLCACTYAVLGNAGNAWCCYRNQARYFTSPNAGVVMAAGAGALGVKVGGDAVYEGKVRQRFELGMGNTPAVMDIKRAVIMVTQGQWLWVLTGLVVAISVT